MNAEMIASLLDAVPLPSVLVGRTERVLGANQAALDLIGQGIVGRHFITAFRQPGLLDAIESCLRDGEQRKTRYLSSDGNHDTSFDVTCSRVVGETNAGVLVCFEDVTHLEQAGQMRRDFVANVSHELRSPLTALLGFIETLRGPAKDDATASQRFLGIMQTETERMERLVRDLLSLGRVEAQQRVRPADPVKLQDVVDVVLHALTPVAEETDVSLHCTMPDAPLVIPGDSDQLQQVVTNLIENAIKYGGVGKSVHVSVSASRDEPLVRGPAAILSVRDEGPGIDQAFLPRLTERFYRVDSHRSREMGGTGLGLAIVKHIISRHRGRLRIESELGQGSVFRVVLPMKTPPQTR